MNFKTISVGVLLMVSALTVYSQATNDSSKKFRRSSIYSIMVHSDSIDKKLQADDETAANSNVIKNLIKSVASDDSKSLKVDPVVVKNLFPTIAIPQQFNDFNLSTRIIELDNFGITEADIKAAEESAGGEKKKKGFGGLAGKAMGAVGVDASKMPALPGTDNVTKSMKAIANKFFEKENTAANLVAKWYNYSDAAKDGGSHYDMGTIQDKGIYSISAEDKRKFEASGEANSKIIDDAVNLIGHTYVMLNYFKYRSNAAIIAELQTYADALGSMGGVAGVAASQAVGAAVSSMAGGGYSVQTNTYLYRLDWANETNEKFYNECWSGTLEDLIKSGMCKLTFVGKEKSRAGVRVGAFSKTDPNELIKRAVLRSLDENIARLQASHEDFRTITPICGVDTKAGEIYAEIGLRENLTPGDEYEVLQPIEGSDGTITYKSIGKFKPVEGKICDNREGAAEDIAEDLQSTDAKVKEAAEKVKGLTNSTFKGGKVKEEYTGCFLRLTKKAKSKNK